MDSNVQPIPTAIVTDVHYRMAVTVLRELKEAGIVPIACESDRYPAKSVVGFASTGGKEQVVLPEARFFEALFDLCQAQLEKTGVKPVLLPVGAATLGQLCRKETRDRFAQVASLCLPSSEDLDLLNDKRRAQALAMKAGIPTPQAFAPQEGEDLETFAARVPTPCVVKPECGEKFGLSAAQRYRIVWSPEALQEAFIGFRTLTGSDPVVQTYLPGGGLGCSVLAVEGKVQLALCHRRLREYPVSGGPSTCAQAVDHPLLVDYARRLLALTRFTGLVMVEFKENSGGEPCFLEANPRVWGSFPLTRAAGVPLSLGWYLAAMGEKMPPVQGEAPGKKGKKMQFALSDFAAGLGYLKKGQPKKTLAVLGDFFNCRVKEGLWEWKDPRPAVRYFLGQFQRRR